MRKLKTPIVAVTSLLLALHGTSHAADLKLATILSDHMVLQRDKPLPVWGWADAGESITVEFAGQKKSAVADAKGKWQVKLDPLKASAESRSLVVQSGKPDRKLEVVDVLVGEVWLGSGQSNMAMRVSGARNNKDEQAAANFTLIRGFNEASKPSAKVQADSSGKWAVCSPDTVGTFSAVMYFFGRELYRELNVPIGLIHSSVGGTAIEAWMAADIQPAESKKAASVDATPREPRPEGESAAPSKQKIPLGGLFNAKIAPLIPYALRGVLWYQGEANTHPGKGSLYQQQLSLLVTDWRKRWGEELPFAWVQLPNFNRPGEGWSLVREAMLKSLSLPKTGMAIAVDLGNAKNIHPKNKQEVGRRLALWALGTVYGVKVPATSGPLPAGREINSDSIAITFKHADGGLVAKDGALTGFVIAGQDKQWKPAQATIRGDKVLVTSPEVAKPVAVRYAWASVAVCNLFNGAGLPASPFRTDTWPVKEVAGEESHSPETPEQ
ncbi:MAG: sialate O-acetylesterase [Luteolibacter sp.]